MRLSYHNDAQIVGATSVSLIISIHSFRGGTGKSNTTANLAAVMAAQGHRVGVMDTDIQSPGIHVLFGMREEDMTHCLNDYLDGQCAIEEAAYDVTERVPGSLPGKIFLIPSSIAASKITRILQEGVDFGALNDGFFDLLDRLELDVLLIDTHPGLNKETLLSITVSDSLLVILRPDRQDYLGTGVTLEVARKLEVPNLMVLVNKVPQSVERERVETRVQEAYDCTVAGVIPHSDELMTLASEEIFSLRYPEHPITAEYRKVVEQLLTIAPSDDEGDN